MVAGVEAGSDEDSLSNLDEADPKLHKTSARVLHNLDILVVESLHKDGIHSHKEITEMYTSFKQSMLNFHQTRAEITLNINEESNSREPQNQGFYQVKMGKVTPTKAEEEDYENSRVSSNSKTNRSWAQVSEVECEHNVAAILTNKYHNLTPKTGGGVFSK